MVNTFTPAQRSENMRRIRSTKTGPEQVVAKTLKKSNLTYTRYDTSLIGKPDFIIRDAGRAVFVHGCFWHQHEGCSRKFMPKSRRGYWKKKLENNVLRFGVVSRQLKKQGWKVSVIWECEAKDPNKLSRRISRYAAKRSRSI